MRIERAGIYDIPKDIYHDDPCMLPSLSSSLARKLLTRSPAHGREDHPRLNPDLERTERELFDLGEAAHTLMLGDIRKFAVLAFDDWRTKEAKAQRDAAYEAGKTPVLAHKMVMVERMVDAGKAQLLRHAECADAFDPALGKPERTVIWQEGGIWIRVRLDWLYDTVADILDYKTTGQSAEPDAWTRYLFNEMYDVQAALYVRGLQAITGKRARFRFVVQETDPPFCLSVIQLTPAAMAMAQRKVDHAIALWSHCQETGRYPGYPARVCHVDPPAYQEVKWTEREQRQPISNDMLAQMLDWQKPLKGAAE
jgi:hypothetical protein